MTSTTELNRLLSELKSAVMAEYGNQTPDTVKATDKAAIALVNAIKASLPVHYVCNPAGDIEIIAKVGMVVNTDWMSYASKSDDLRCKGRVELRHIEQFVEGEG